MEEKQATQDGTPQAVIESYLQAVKDQDMDRCLDFYADDATLYYMKGEFKGKDALREWHQERFDAQFEFVKISKITAEADKVVVDASVTSKRIKAWKIGKLAGKATFLLEDGKIKETKFKPRMYNPFEGW